jgi:hypothetical protein
MRKSHQRSTFNRKARCPEHVIHKQTVTSSALIRLQNARRGISASTATEKPLWHFENLDPEAAHRYV